MGWTGPVSPPKRAFDTPGLHERAAKAEGVTGGLLNQVQRDAPCPSRVTGKEPVDELDIQLTLVRGYAKSCHFSVARAGTWQGRLVSSSPANIRPAVAS